MKHNEELAKFLVNEILFINEVFPTCSMNMLVILKIQLKHAVLLTWKDRNLPPARSANRKNCKDPMDERNYRERNNEAVQRTRKKQNEYEKELMDHIEELKDALISLRNLAFGITKQPGPPLIKTQNLRTRMESKDEINYRENYITTKLRQKSV